MHTLGMIILWMAAIYMAIQAVIIIFHVVVIGGVGLGGAVCMAFAWIRRHPVVLLAAAVLAMISAAVLLT